MIVFQFTISLVFIIASLVMGSQLRYVLHTNLGFQTDAIITLGGQPTNPMHTTTIESDKTKGGYRLGLAIFSTERRAREIGIRKVLGASVAGIVVLLCQEIVFLSMLALLLASPLAWYLMHGWLEGFAYRTTLSGWLFVAAGLAAIGLALLTVGFQSVKAALMNPVKSLRSE